MTTKTARKPKPLTATGVAGARQILGRQSDAAVYMLVARRAIPYRKVRGRLVFFEEELREWMDAQPGGVRLEDL
jgi:hypothetical protein